MRSVSIGDVTFGSPPVVDGDGCQWVLSGFEGWDNGGAGVRRETVPRPNAHGVFAQRAWRGGRALGLTGTVLCPSRAVAGAVVGRLAALLADGEDGYVSVGDADQPTMHVWAGLAAEPVVDWFNPTAVRVGLDLFAADPLRYGALVTASSAFPEFVGGLEYDLYTDGAGTDLGYLNYGVAGASGQVSVTNTGTAATWPTFDVAGPIPDEGFELVRVDTGDRLVFEGAVPEGSALVLDSATGAVLIDGTADRGGLLTHRGWSSVGPGETGQWAFVARGARTDAVVTVALSPAFW